MRRLAALVLTSGALALAGCGGGASITPGSGAGGGRAPQSSSLNSTAAWSVYNYNAANTSLTPKSASFDGTTATFSFQAGVYTSRLTTNAKPLTGDLTGKTLTDTVTVTGATAPFQTHFGGGCGNPPAVRFFFVTQQGGGFAYTNYWWSNPMSYVLANGTATLTASLADPHQWSDFNGQFGDTDAATQAAFLAATADVQSVGLSFGGDCFFENGATTPDGSGTFSSRFSES